MQKKLVRFAVLILALGFVLFPIQASSIPPDTLTYPPYTWHLRDSHTDGPAHHSFVYGDESGDMFVKGDWNGDGIETAGIVRAVDSNLFWHLKNTHTAGPADITFPYGSAGDRPIAGDWNGDGIDTPAVVRATGDTWTWFLHNANGPGVADITLNYGATAASERLVVGDWDGNGTDTPGVARRSEDPDYIRWYLRNSNTSGVADLVFRYGLAGGADRPVVGDWNGDRTTTVGIVRVSPDNENWEWHIRNSNSEGPAVVAYRYGLTSDVIIFHGGDWNGDGPETAGVIRQTPV